MRTIKLTTGAEVEMDGDLLAVIETLYRELTVRNELGGSFEDTVREIQSVIDQMSDDERKTYLQESLFLNFVTYENDRLSRLVDKVTRRKTHGQELR